MHEPTVKEIVMRIRKRAIEFREMSNDATKTGDQATELWAVMTMMKFMEFARELESEMPVDGEG